MTNNEAILEGKYNLWFTVGSSSIGLKDKITILVYLELPHSQGFICALEVEERNNFPNGMQRKILKLSNLCVQGADSKKIFYLREINDAAMIVEALKANKNAKAIVVRGGYVGLELTVVLRLNNIKVDMVYPELCCMPQPFTEGIVAFYEGKREGLITAGMVPYLFLAFSMLQLACRDLTRDAVCKSLVLLKNGKDPKKPFLPLDKTAKKILIDGAHADDLGYQCRGWTVTWIGLSGIITVGVQNEEREEENDEDIDLRKFFGCG
ncbi:Monodehydroascorbate reductase [Capsicum chinense]|nr:Monodehydroascorbate reductase [Capsicum chinense]